MIAERHANGVRHETIIPRVALHIGGMRTKPTPNVYEPALCLVLQGAKQAMIGDRLLRYDPASYFIATIELPASGWVVEATPTKPYIAVSMRLDTECLSSLISDMPSASEGQTRGFAISAVTPDLLDAWSRLLSLLDTPQDVPVLAPMHEREVLYRLLNGPQGGALRQIARVDSRLSQVRQAIAWISIALQRSAARGAARQAGGNEPGVISPPFQGGDRDEPASISEDAASPGGATAADHQCRCGARSLRGRLREPLAVQPRIRPHVRRAARARRRALARQALSWRASTLRPCLQPAFPAGLISLLLLRPRSFQDSAGPDLGPAPSTVADSAAPI